MKHDYFESVDSEAKAYWLGFLFADGNVSQPSSGRSVITISQKEADVPASFLATIESGNRICENTGRWGNSYRGMVNSSKMVSDLVSWGCTPAKSLTLQPPQKDLGLWARDFIRGYNDGDGGFYSGRQNRMRVRGTVALLTWMQSELPKGSLLYPQGPTAQLFVVKKSVLSDTVRYLYEGATVYLDRKFQVARNFADPSL